MLALCRKIGHPPIIPLRCANGHGTCTALTTILRSNDMARNISLMAAFAFSMFVSASANAIAHPGDSPLERILGRGIAGGIGMGILIGLILLLYKAWTAIERTRKRRSTLPLSATSNTSSTIGLSDAATTPPTQHADALYEQALTELENGQTVKAIWARALVEGNGDAGKARATYIRLRVAQAETQEQGKTEARVEANAITHVPGSKRWAIIGVVGVLALFIIVGLASFLTGPTKLTFTTCQSCNDGKCESSDSTTGPTVKLTVDESKKTVLQEVFDATGALKSRVNIAEGMACTFVDSHDWFCQKAKSEMIDPSRPLFSHTRDEVRLRDGRFQSVHKLHWSDSRGSFNEEEIKSDCTK